jgi:hypothetical protein
MKRLALTPLRWRRALVPSDDNLVVTTVESPYDLVDGFTASTRLNGDAVASAAVPAGDPANARSDKPLPTTFIELMGHLANLVLDSWSKTLRLAMLLVVPGLTALVVLSVLQLNPEKWAAVTASCAAGTFLVATARGRSRRRSQRINGDPDGGGIPGGRKRES